MSGRAYPRLLSGLWLAAGSLRRRRPPKQVRRILVLHRHLLGDMLMLTGMLAKLRERYPTAHIVMAGAGDFGSLYATRPYGVEYLRFDIKSAHSLHQLRRAGPYDLAVLTAENRWASSARAFGAAWIVGFADEIPAKRNRLVDELRPYSATPTAWSDTVSELIDGPPPAAYHPSQWPMPPCRPFVQPAGNYCVLHVGTSASLKLWPAARWRDLASQLAARGLTPVWSGGPGEEPLVAECDPDARWPSYAGQLDLPQAWSLVAGARCLVSVDTSIAHLGRIAATPTIALFGQGSALLCGAGDFWRDMPFRALSVDIACRNQQRNFARMIPWIRRCERLPGEQAGQCARSRCMDAIDVDAVLDSVAELGVLSRPPGAA